MEPLRTLLLGIDWFNYVIFVGSVSTSESMIHRPCFQALHTVSFQFCYMFAHNDTYFRLHLLLIIITTTCISLSLRRTSAPIHLPSVLGVLGTQETFCIVIAGLLERDIFDLLLPEFDKPWVIHLRETCCCSTKLCTWRPNTVYKNRRMRRHQAHQIHARHPSCKPPDTEKIKTFYLLAQRLRFSSQMLCILDRCHPPNSILCCTHDIDHKVHRRSMAFN
jgi:hypothetical protein